VLRKYDMPSLSRRRSQNPHQETWHVYFEGVQVGTIAERAGVPTNVERWGWECGFSPALDRGIRAAGIAQTFDQACRFRKGVAKGSAEVYRAGFCATSLRARAHSLEIRHVGCGCKMPTQTVDGSAKCFCGAPINTKSIVEHILACDMDVS
jgi:hypothetical protein